MNAQRGFTLVEVLVALVVLAVGSSLAYRALDLFQTGTHRLADESRALGRMVSVFARMQLDVERVVNARLYDRRQREVPLMRSLPHAGVTEWSAGFEVVRAGGDSLQGRARRVSYRLNGDRLEYGLWPDTDAVPAPVETFTLLEGVRSCRVRFLDAQGRWAGALAGATPVLPRAVQVELDVTGIGLVQRTFALP
jgi:general secretion pathway protein J